jgi:Cullin binding
MAIPVLEVLFATRGNKHVQAFVEFLTTSEPVRGLNKDQWDSFYVFSTTMDEEFSGYSVEAAWPILFDEFVAWKRQQS